MPKAWSDKRERQYEHIKQGLEDKGPIRGHSAGDRCSDGQQGAGTVGGVRAGESYLHGGHLVEPPRRTPIASRCRRANEAAAL